MWTGSTWKVAGSAVNGTSVRQVYTATASQTTFAITYDVGFVDVYINGVKQVLGSDFTATSGTNIVLASGATAGDIVDIVAYGAFSVSDTYTKAESDARFINLSLKPTGTIVGTTDTQALTNKTIDYNSNTITNLPASTPFANSTSLAQTQAIALCF